MRLRDEGQLTELFEFAPQLDDRSWLIRMMAEAGAVLDGHFILQSGRHSQHFIRFSDLADMRKNADALAAAMTSTIEDVARDGSATVLCAESAGVLLGHAVARQLAASLAVTKIDTMRRPTPVLRRGTIPVAGPLVIVNDVCTSGDSLRPLITAAEEAGAELRAVICFAVRDAGALQRLVGASVRTIWLVRPTWKTYEPADCPLCIAKQPAIPAIELN